MSKDLNSPKRWSKRKEKNNFSPMWQKFGDPKEVDKLFQEYRPFSRPQWKRPPIQEKKIERPIADQKTQSKFFLELKEKLDRKSKK